MSGEGIKGPGIEGTLFELLENSGARDMDQGNLLILLSLVNLMGIINIINSRLGTAKGAGAGTEGISPAGPGPEGSPEPAPGRKGQPFDPSPLLAILAGKGGETAGPGQLASLLNRFMGAPEGKPGGPVSGNAGAGKAPSADKGDEKPGEEVGDKTGGQ